MFRLKIIITIPHLPTFEDKSLDHTAVGVQSHPDTLSTCCKCGKLRSFEYSPKRINHQPNIISRDPSQFPWTFLWIFYWMCSDGGPGCSPWLFVVILAVTRVFVIDPSGHPSCTTTLSVEASLVLSVTNNIDRPLHHPPSTHQVPIHSWPIFLWYISTQLYVEKVEPNLTWYLIWFMSNTIIKHKVINVSLSISLSIFHIWQLHVYFNKREHSPSWGLFGKTFCL